MGRLNRDFWSQSTSSLWQKVIRMFFLSVRKFNTLNTPDTLMKKLALLALPAAFALALTTNAFAADGKAVYADNCAKCHGDDGKGATKMGQKLGARDYTDAKVQDAVTDADAFKSIKEGMKKDDKTLMKPSELADDDIKASVTYLRTFKK
jgi:mono/diheme cytochrome c family protein